MKLKKVGLSTKEETMKAWKFLLLASLIGVFSLVAISCGDDDDDDDDADDDDDSDDDDDDEPFALTSSAFGSGDNIPTEYSCNNPDQADGISPPLSWTGAPEGTMFFALTMIDPDAGPTKHWGVFDIPPDTTGFLEAMRPDGVLPGDAWESLNYTGVAGYAGPCPPAGETHDYVFTIYALDEGMPDFDTTPELDAMMGHIAEREIESTSLTAQYGE
jgi:Raf kinase inhibitor-like YbhB/YbcL family protein